MGKILVTINKEQRKKYNILEEELSFDELEKRFILMEAKESLKKAVAIAKKTGLSKMKNSEINKIIKSVRKRA
ncbi:MAG: hypothetical protein L0Y35_01490 [Flammeovirgaceae bacterium]|nr:hypothetical protein [Flammeovirgaceae bacterium]